MHQSLPNRMENQRNSMKWNDCWKVIDSNRIETCMRCWFARLWLKLAIHNYVCVHFNAFQCISMHFSACALLLLCFEWRTKEKNERKQNQFLLTKANRNRKSIILVLINCGHSCLMFRLVLWTKWTKTNKESVRTARHKSPLSCTEMQFCPR